MRGFARLLMAANSLAGQSSALMVNELFAPPRARSSQARKTKSGFFLIFFNALEQQLLWGPLFAPLITAAFPRHIKFYSNSAQMRWLIQSRL